MDKKREDKPDSTAERVALWRAMHVELDSLPHIIEDTVGLQLIAPDPSWKNRADMDPQRTKTFRGSIVSRARFIEDLAIQEAVRGVDQYVILGAGLDTFAQRRVDVASKLNIFEIDQPLHQAWKKKRLIELGMGVSETLHFVPVNFEVGESWWSELVKAGFDVRRPAVVSSTGLSMYLTREAIMATLRQLSKLAAGSTFAMTFMIPLEHASPDERSGREAAERGARMSGTPFISFFTPAQILNLAREAGFKKVEHISAGYLAERYFKGRPDGLRPSTSEEFLLATT